MKLSKGAVYYDKVEVSLAYSSDQKTWAVEVTSKHSVNIFDFIDCLENLVLDLRRAQENLGEEICQLDQKTEH